MRYFLGIDSGTSGVKAIVVSEEGEMISTGYHECDLITPKPGWVEQNPKDWWRACKAAITQAAAKSGQAKNIAAIGMTGQMLGSTMLDKDMEPIGNCMIWLDQRATKERDEIEQKLDIRPMLDITANYCLTGFWAPKLMWLKKHKPEEFDRAKLVLFTKDYLAYQLTGEIATEVADASGSFLLDVPNRQWSDKMFEVCGLSKDIVPKRVVESQEIVGTLKADLAAEFGLTTGIPVIAGAGDQPSCGVGSGVVRTGVISATIGTSGVVFACTDTPFADEQRRAALSMCHAVPEKWCFFGCTLGAGGSFKWVRDTMFADRKIEMAKQGKDVYDYMTELAARTSPSAEGLTFLPYLNGERTPYPDENAKGVFFGLSYRHGLGEICRSVMEGVTYSLRDTIEILREFNLDVTEVRAQGGGARSQLWRQMQADIYNAAVVTTNLEEGTAAGAAILAAVGSGCFDSVAQAADKMVKVVSRTEPIAKNVEMYNEFYQTYRALYPIMKEQFAKQAGLVNKWLVD